MNNKNLFIVSFHVKSEEEIKAIHGIKFGEFFCEYHNIVFSREKLNKMFSMKNSGIILSIEDIIEIFNRGAFVIMFEFIPCDFIVIDSISQASPEFEKITGKEMLVIQNILANG